MALIEPARPSERPSKDLYDQRSKQNLETNNVHSQGQDQPIPAHTRRNRSQSQSQPWNDGNLNLSLLNTHELPASPMRPVDPLEQYGNSDIGLKSLSQQEDHTQQTSDYSLDHRNSMVIKQEESSIRTNVRGAGPVNTHDNEAAPGIIFASTDSMNRYANLQALHNSEDQINKSEVARSPEPFDHVPLQAVVRDPDQVKKSRNLTIETKGTTTNGLISPQPRPLTSRALSTPAHIKSSDLFSAHSQRPTKPRTSSKLEASKPQGQPQTNHALLPSPMPPSIPLPPLSLPTYLQLELSSHRPSQLYIYRTANSDFPYESSRVKVERLLNFLFLPYELEAVLWFGTLACFDAWLYTFTILPLRLLKSCYILLQSWVRYVSSETRLIAAFIYNGTPRMWQRSRIRGESISNDSTRRTSNPKLQDQKPERAQSQILRRHHHQRSKSVPSTLLPDDKADILKGLLIICTCLILLRLDASRMYHWVRGQAAIKLYVIYNVLEVCDRLLSAIGQDVLECLFSQESLERKADGHSKVLRPFWLFILALGYTVTHAVALFYQVVTLNVAVNSYSNALITLLMSNQFVEIKSTVFKKFEKENLFQLTCADIVERFQLWHMLLIIAARNIVETGGLSWGFNTLTAQTASTFASSTINNSTSASSGVPPLSAASILPSSFMFLPSLVTSISSYMPTVSHVLGPFVIVLGSEMLIDWLKHAYIGKFNNSRPVMYSRFLDILAKDYYTNAFSDQNLTKRLGLPIIPLSCLMIRASVQTYQMFVAAWMPDPSPSATSLADIHEQYSASRNSTPTSTATIMVQKIDALLYQIPSGIVNSDIASHFTTFLTLILLFLVLLACKLVLGMILLAFSRSRYRRMKERDRNPPHHVDGGRRTGGWGVVEIDEDKRRKIYEDDPLAMRKLNEREAKEAMKREQEKEKGPNLEGLDKVMRYEMAAKRIW